MPVNFIAIGASLGGLEALKTVFSGLPKGFTIPIAVVLHRQASEQDYLCEALQQSTDIKIKEGYDKSSASTPEITLAPAGYHLLVENTLCEISLDEHQERCSYALSTDVALYGARPSIDMLFESVADCFGSKAIGILLTGGGVDGVEGLRTIKAKGGKVIVQDPTTATNPELPQNAISAGVADIILPLNKIGAEFYPIN